MAQSNVKTRRPIPRTHEGAPASRISTEQTLKRLVMAALLFENQFYVDGIEHANLVQELVAKSDPSFVSDLMIEARTNGNLRHIPLLLGVALARLGRLSAATLTGVIQRADEIAEFLALYWKDGRCPISRQVKRGLANAFHKFNEYQFAKYNRKRDIHLRDVMFLTHPVPRNDDEKVLFAKIANNTLSTPDTWEVRLSASKGKDKQNIWAELITNNKLGGLATLRNLRNMAEAGVPRSLINHAIVHTEYSRVLPFRFVAAEQAVPEFRPKLEEAFFAEARHWPKLPGTTVLLVDVSGSMSACLSANSDMDRMTAAGALAMIAVEICDDVIIIPFASSHSRTPVVHGFELIDSIHRKSLSLGGGTVLGLAVDTANAIESDRLIVITDEQSSDQVRDPVAPKAYMINVASYINGVGYGSKWTHINGFSESVFSFIYECEGSGWL